jgi:hyperosmotically inducible periplasmic protein
MKKLLILSCGILLGLADIKMMGAQVSSLSRDAVVQTAITHQLDGKKEFRGVTAQVKNGVVTLAGSVDLYQQKLNAAKRVKKAAGGGGIQNEISVIGQNVSDSDLAAQLDRKLYYDRMGYDIAFNFVTATVNDGVATLNGETRDEFDRDSALWLVDNTPGVKDVIDNVEVSPVSIFDDQIRLSALRRIYRDPVLERYAIDPARPIRIVVDRGKLALYGTVATAMDKQIAGVQAAQVFGAFSVQNNLAVAKKG